MTNPSSTTLARWRNYPVSNFESLVPVWDALQSVVAPVPVLHSDFIRVGLRHFGSGRERLAVCGNANDPVAMGIFDRVGTGSWQTFQPSQFPLGPFLMRDGVGVETLLPGLTRCLPGFPLVTSLTQVDTLLVRPPREIGSSQSIPYIETAWVDVVGTFDEYWSARGKNLRHNVKRQTAKFVESGTSTVLQVIERPEHVARAIAEYAQLEGAGWKAGEGTAVQPGTPQGDFYKTLLEAFCASGHGRVYAYCIDDRIAAVDLCIEQGDVLVVLKTAYDESLKSISPATLMRHEYFRQIFEEGRIRRIEFYGRVMEWHTRWTDKRRPLVHVNHYRWPWLARLREIRAAKQQGATI